MFPEMTLQDCQLSICRLHGWCDHHSSCLSNCYCHAGYTGTCCETEINECYSNPCHNGGSCNDLVNGYLCSCLPGFIGANCEVEINECLSNPCRNSGSCSDLINGYLCSCIRGFTGTNCEADINECFSSPCRNSGSCIDLVNGYSCSCIHGFTGTHCEAEINVCASNPCSNGGTCTNYLTHYMCQCDDGYSGPNCEIGSYITDVPHIVLDTSKNVDEGSDIVKIPCFAEGIPTPTIKWELIDNKFPANVKQLAHYLVMENVTTDDSGYYMCTAKNSAGTDLKVIHITVEAKPLKLHTAPLINVPSMVEVKYYTDVSLVCHVTGFPTPAISWSFKNETIPTTGETLLIHRVTNSSIGVYSCIAANDAGTSTAKILLQVTYDPSKIISPPLPIVTTAGESHNFTCKATGHPTPHITWSFTSFSHYPSQIPPHVVFENETVIEMVNMQESGVLSCTAQNEFGVDKASAHVVVKHTSPVVG